MAKNTVEPPENINKEKSFSKKSFLLSKDYKIHKDLINTILEDGKSYTKSEVDKLINNYLKGVV